MSPQQTSGNLLEVRGLSVDLPSPDGMLRVVDDVDLDIAPDTIVGLVGESGSGKSITCKSIARLLPDGARVTGEIRYDGTDLLSLPAPALEDVRGAQIGYVFQDPMTSLNPSLTVGTQIAETLRRHRGLGRTAARREAERLLDLVGIPGAARRFDSYPREFSGGMRQRALIAIAISCEPKLLIADEPTTALDVTIQAQVLELLREMRDRLSLAILFVTHDLGVIADICDDVVVLYGGEVMERAPSLDLFAGPRHPYTQRLLGALRRDRAAPLVTIPGSPPAPGAWPTGCRFEPRCDLAFDRCAEHPELVSGGVRCHLHDPEAAA